MRLKCFNLLKAGVRAVREPSELPVLSGRRGRTLPEAIPSLKSHTTLTTVYAAGLRVSKVVC
jgi:hypothetical protein